MCHIKVCIFLKFSYEVLTFCIIITVQGTKQSQVEGKLIKDGKVLPLKDVEIIVGEEKVTYRIKKPTREGSGIYQLKVSNAQGEDVKDINIIMQGIILDYNYNNLFIHTTFNLFLF